VNAGGFPEDGEYKVLPPVFRYRLRLKRRRRAVLCATCRCSCGRGSRAHDRGIGGLGQGVDDRPGRTGGAATHGGPDATSLEARSLAEKSGIFWACFHPLRRGLYTCEPGSGPLSGLSPHPDIAAARACALWRLLQDSPVVAVASVRAAAVKLHSRSASSPTASSSTRSSRTPGTAAGISAGIGLHGGRSGNRPGEFSLRAGSWTCSPHMNIRCASNSSATRLSRCGCLMSIPRGPSRLFPGRARSDAGTLRAPAPARIMG